MLNSAIKAIINMFIGLKKLKYGNKDSTTTEYQDRKFKKHQIQIMILKLQYKNERQSLNELNRRSELAKEIIC